MRIIKKKLLLLLLLVCPLIVDSQQVNTLYYMENLPVRNIYNPAFQPISDVYVSLPVIGYLQASLGNNSISLKDLIYKHPDETDPITALYDEKEKLAFYNKIQPVFSIYSNLHINLLTVGFRRNSSFWTVSINEKIDASSNIPKDFFRLILMGTRQENQTNFLPIPVSFDFSSFTVDLKAYTEFALGYAVDINDQWSVGCKAKFLYGNMNFSNVNYFTKFNLSAFEYTGNSNGSINSSTPFGISYSPNLFPLTINNDISKNPMSLLKPSGLGGGIDLGVDYWATDQLSLSLAVNDLGFIYWNKANNVSYDAVYYFDGFRNETGFSSNDFMYLGSLTKLENVVDSLMIGMKSNQTINSNSYVTYTNTKLNAGIEYRLFDNNLSLGLLSRTYFTNINISEEITPSLNYRPTDWFNAALSYSVFNGKFRNLGLGIGLQTSIFHWFIAADYIPLEFYKPFIPASTSTFNIALGMNLVFNYPSAAELAAKGKQKLDDRYGCPSCDERMPVKKLRRHRAISKQQELPTYNRKTEPIVGPMYGR